MYLSKFSQNTKLRFQKEKTNKIKRYNFFSAYLLYYKIIRTCSHRCWRTMEPPFVYLISVRTSFGPYFPGMCYNYRSRRKDTECVKGRGRGRLIKLRIIYMKVLFLKWTKTTWTRKDFRTRWEIIALNSSTYVIVLDVRPGVCVFSVSIYFCLN